MVYQFRHNLSVQDSFQEIAKEILEEALTECRSTDLTQHEKIHSLRKRCKRIRGLLRILRPCIGEIYKKENQYYRDLARNLSVSRDQHAAIETLSKLKEIPNNKTSFDKYDFLIKNIRSSFPLVMQPPWVWAQLWPDQAM